MDSPSALEEQLTEYHDLVVELEDELLSDITLPVSLAYHTPLFDELTSSGLYPPNLQVSHLYYRLHTNHYTSTLPVLASVVKQVQSEQTNGAGLLDMLFQRAAVSPPQCAACLNRLAKACNCVMLRMCETWMLYGRLADPHNEFFVVRNTIQQVCMDWPVLKPRLSRVLYQDADQSDEEQDLSSTDE